MTEPRTLEEMHARAKAAKARMFAAGAAFEQRRRANPPPPKFRPMRSATVAPQPTPEPAPRSYEGEAWELFKKLTGNYPEKRYVKAVEIIRRDLLLPLLAPPVVRKAVRELSEETGVPAALILGRTRLRAAVDARQELYLRVKTATGRSYPEVARMCGARDHTTIIYGIRTARRRREMFKGGHNGEGKTQV